MTRLTSRGSFVHLLSFQDLLIILEKLRGHNLNLKCKSLLCCPCGFQPKTLCFLMHRCALWFLITLGCCMDTFAVHYKALNRLILYKMTAHVHLHFFNCSCVIFSPFWMISKREQVMVNEHQVFAMCGFVGVKALCICSFRSFCTSLTSYNVLFVGFTVTHIP